MPKESSKPRITIRQVAQKAKVSPATVSLALKGDNRIRASTQKHVQDTARKLGYCPDPALSALAAYRYDKKARKAYGTIGFINTFEDFATFSHQLLWFDDYLRGLKKQCQHYGYEFEEFSVSLRNRTKQKQLSRTLYNQGVNGLVIGPFKDKAFSIDFNWPKFSVVATSVTNENSGIPYATNDYFQNLSLTVQKLLNLGYQRIAFAQPSHVEERLGYRWTAAYLRETYCCKHEAKRFLPPWLMPSSQEFVDFQTFSRWVQQQRPDVIITSCQTLFQNWLNKMGMQIPEDIGLVGLQVESDQKEYSGIAQSIEYCGQLIVDLLHSKIMKRERGLPEVNYSINVQSKWTQGTMLRAQNST